MNKDDVKRTIGCEAPLAVIIGDLLMNEQGSESDSDSYELSSVDEEKQQVLTCRSSDPQYKEMNNCSEFKPSTEQLILVVLITSLTKGNCLKTYNLAASRMLKIQKVTLHLLKELVMFQ